MLFFSACVGSGVAFLVAIGSLRGAIEAAIAARARELLAADLELSSYRPFAPKTQSAVKRLEREGYGTAEIVSFSSMLLAPGKEPFLASVKAISPGYPFYGRLETDPQGIRLSGRECLLDETAALQRGFKLGDPIRLGELELRLAGYLVKEPDRTMAGFNLAPRLMIPLHAVGSTGLLKFGSRIRYSKLIALPKGGDGREEALRLKERLSRELDDPYLSLAVYTDADPSVRQMIERVSSFFVFLSLVALLLGAVGMAASFSMFLNDQIETVGTLRCLGLRPADVGQVYGLLCLAVGIQGGVMGAAGGWILGNAFLEPVARLLKLTIPVAPHLEWALLGEGFLLACALALALNGVRVAALSRISAMDALRARAALSLTPRVHAVILILGVAALFFYAFAKSNSWQAASSFALSVAGCSLATVLLILVAHQALSRVPLHKLGFSARHGLLALTRHRARSLIFLFTLSIGLTLLGAVGIVHHSLSSEILLGRSKRAPDHFLVDIQKSQLAGVQKILSRYADIIAKPAPLIRARLTHVNGAPIVRRDTTGMTVEELTRQRFLTREYNLTYKDELQESERVVQGRFWNPGESGAEISLERSFAERIDVRLGDGLSFDVQGRPVEGTVRSIRRIDWISMQPNFFVVFPARVLESAPQILITSVRVGDPLKASQLRRALGAAYPNISVIDISKVLDNVQSVLSAILGALRLLAWFCFGVGLLVLGGTLGLNRGERLRQAALYRTLGCTAKDLVRMDAVEFLAIGSIALVIAAATSHLLAWAIARQMQVGLAVDLVALFVMAGAALLLPLCVGLAVYRPAYRDQVLIVLRQEG